MKYTILPITILDKVKFEETNETMETILVSPDKTEFGLSFNETPSFLSGTEFKEYDQDMFDTITNFYNWSLNGTN